MTNVKEIFEGITNNILLNAKPINYFFGYWNLVASELLSMGRSATLSKERYPLIFLHADFSEKVKKTEVTEINPTFYIITTTKANYTIQERLDNVYKPILYPIYSEFLKQIRLDQNLFQTKLMEHEKKDLFYLQTLTADQNKIFDIVDAIEIKFNSLLIKSKNI